jgi:hypothetical protein
MIHVGRNLLHKSDKKQTNITSCFVMTSGGEKNERIYRRKEVSFISKLKEEGRIHCQKTKGTNY